MSRTNLTKRMVIRISDDLDAWIGEQATREGLDNATWARATLTRIMNGVMPIGSQPQPAPPAWEPEAAPPLQNADDLDAFLDDRVAQVVESSRPSQFLTAPSAADDLSHELVTAAQPLRRVDRVKYNPGRGGYG